MSAWPTASLGDVFDISRGGSPRPIDSFITDVADGINWIMIGDAPEGSKYISSTKKRIRPEGAKKSRAVNPGDFLLTNSMSFGRPYIMRTSGCIHDGWLVLSPRQEISPDFFYHLLGSDAVYAEFERLAAGATVKNLNSELVRGVKIRVPPLPEQRRIAEMLDKADALRAKRRAAIVQLDTLTQSIFLDMFGDPATNPKRWPRRPFADVCETRLGKMLDKKRQTGKSQRLYLRNANVQWFRFDLSNMLQMDFNPDERSVLRLKKGDLLICEGGEPGRCAVWDDDLEECYFQKALHRARPDPKQALSAYLGWLLWFLSARGMLSGVTSATIAHLTGEKLAQLPVLLPPVSLQLEFAARLRGLSTLRNSYSSASGGVDALFSSIQKAVFEEG